MARAAAETVTASNAVHLLIVTLCTLCHFLLMLQDTYADMLRKAAYQKGQTETVRQLLAAGVAADAADMVRPPPAGLCLGVAPHGQCPRT
jgi:hypothetical protein